VAADIDATEHGDDHRHFGGSSISTKAGGKRLKNGWVSRSLE
jgi:hypothetical protein